ncbi:hypothetical protein HPB50_026511 [Hyalomma asiaticum]|uniref:Uncharacterized protein n=1 Tax=Hyalomma asiaticum TaxID=266040 RepID=A0ACB7T537_HYAAI|nr:hypothetical protein HPB50_026511 [Hyalomma asiaticum]
MESVRPYARGLRAGPRRENAAAYSFSLFFFFLTARSADSLVQNTGSRVPIRPPPNKHEPARRYKTRSPRRTSTRDAAPETRQSVPPGRAGVFAGTGLGIEHGCRRRGGGDYGWTHLLFPCLSIRRYC